MNINPFPYKDKWYKGNLHCHSTESDGRLSPSEVAAIYKSRGWNFLAYTEHRLYTHHKEFDDENFIIIPGVELDVRNEDPLKIYHVVGVGRTDGAGKEAGYKHGEMIARPTWEGLETAQGMIDDLNRKGNLSIFCHPIWSRLELDDFIGLDGFFAMELYNTGCALESHTGLCVDYWDSLLRRGRKVWGVAADDCHHVLQDQCGGWVMVNAPELTIQAITGALEKGHFYSSTGPEIYSLMVQDNKVYVECSPVKAVHFVAYEELGHSYWAPKGGTITSAKHRLNGREKYVRIECVDKEGNTAWSNPIFLK